MFVQVHTHTIPTHNSFQAPSPFLQAAEDEDSILHASHPWTAETPIPHSHSASLVGNQRNTGVPSCKCTLATEARMPVYLTWPIWEQVREQTQSCLASESWCPSIHYPSNCVHKPVHHQTIRAHTKYILACTCLYSVRTNIYIVGLVGRATAHDALCRGFDPCRQRPRGVAVDFGPKQSGSSAAASPCKTTRHTFSVISFLIL